MNISLANELQANFAPVGLVWIEKGGDQVIFQDPTTREWHLSGIEGSFASALEAAQAFVR